MAIYWSLFRDETFVIPLTASLFVPILRERKREDGRETHEIACQQYSDSEIVKYSLPSQSQVKIALRST